MTITTPKQQSVNAMQQHHDSIEQSAAPETMSWILYGHLHENSQAIKMKIESQPFRIGRHQDNSACLQNGTVSGYHAEIVAAGEQMLLRDCGSTNGTLLNGRRLKTIEPLRDGDIIHFGEVMFVVRQEADTDRAGTETIDALGDAIAQVQLSTLINRPGVQPFFQPIVELGTHQRIGFEVLTRSQLIGLETPDKMFRVAAQQTKEAALSRVCRVEGMKASDKLDPEMSFYLNTHPAELNTPDLFDSLYLLREYHPEANIVLEIHESGVTSVDYLKQLQGVLQELNMGLAYDDFGAGQARLAELIEVPPDILKFDVKLVQGLPTASEARRSTVAGLIKIVTDLGVQTLAEGIETQEEAEICGELGFELAQGYLFGKGEPVSTWVNES